MVPEIGELNRSLHIRLNGFVCSPPAQPVDGTGLLVSDQAHVCLDGAPIVNGFFVRPSRGDGAIFAA